jgi:hypothetical protein
MSALWTTLAHFIAMLAPFIAIAVIVVGAWIAVVLINAVRRYDFRLFEDKSAAALAEEFRLPELTSSTAEERRKSLSPLIAKVSWLCSCAEVVSTIICCRRCSWSPACRPP